MFLFLSKKNVVLCNHVLSKERPVRLITRFNNEYQLACNYDDHDNYFDFHSLNSKQLLAIGIAMDKFPKLKRNQIAEWDNNLGTWIKRVELEQNLSSVSIERNITSTYNEFIKSALSEKKICTVVDSQSQLISGGGSAASPFVVVWADSQSSPEIDFDSNRFNKKTMALDEFDLQLLRIIKSANYNAHIFHNDQKTVLTLAELRDDLLHDLNVE